MDMLTLEKETAAAEPEAEALEAAADTNSEHQGSEFPLCEIPFDPAQRTNPNPNPEPPALHSIQTPHLKIENGLSTADSRSYLIAYRKSGYLVDRAISFTVFVDFINHQARIRNDPSFNLFDQTDAFPRVDKAPWKSYRPREVSVHKTEVSPETSPASDGPTKSTDDPKKQCPIHRRPHPLIKCCAFRAKPLEEHKAFLREKIICFKCCSSTSHMAKNCESSVRCSECESDKHVCALHPGPTPQTKESDPSSEHGGEEDPTIPLEATTRPQLSIFSQDLLWSVGNCRKESFRLSSGVFGWKVHSRRKLTCSIDDNCGSTAFQQTCDDDKVVLSIEDLSFLQMMEQGLKKDDSNSWEEDRNFLRFLWFQNNDPAKDIIECRMRVHFFGNSPSPAVAIYCLRQSVQDGDPDVKQFSEPSKDYECGLQST
eukprot:superscaffoldBa00002325_g13922